MCAQSRGGQTKRVTTTNQVKRKPAQAVRKKPTTVKTYSPVDMEPETYYLCINETWIVANGQALCRKMAAKGYKAELLKNPDPSLGYHVCVKKEKLKAAALEFVRLFDDDRYHIAYVFYNGEMINLVSDDPITINDLYPYNIVVGAFANLSDANVLCKDFRERLWPSEVYYDIPSSTYLVIARGTQTATEAQDKLTSVYMRNNFPNAYILYVKDGKAERLER